MANWRIFKGRPEWRTTVPGRPWTVLRLSSVDDDGYECWNGVGVYPTWLAAVEAVGRAITSGVRGD